MKLSVYSTLLFICILFSGCITKYEVPSIPHFSEEPELYITYVEDKYQIQIGDALAVQSYFDPRLNQEAVVRPDGIISLVLLGDVVAVHKTPEELAEFINDAYSKQESLNKPDISVVVKQVADRKVYFGGEVRNPSVLSYNGPLTLLQGVIQTGGFLSTANLEQVLLLRKGSTGGHSVYQVNVQEVLMDKNADVYLSQNDIVYVPRTSIADINLFIDQHINKVIPNFARFNINYQFIDNIGGQTIETSTIP
jgi:protein involved in polysaccharide export with SLBB domain